MNKTVYIALSMVFCMGLLAQGAGTFTAGQSNTDAAADAPSVAGSKAPTSSDTSDALEIHRDSGGQFRLNAGVNGQEAGFLVDTGADTVALTVSEAQRLGFDIDPDSFQAVGQTASGVGYGAPVTIESIEIAGSEVRNIDAVVMEGLEENLLGQSVLGQLEGVELRGDKMLIHRR